MFLLTVYVSSFEYLVLENEDFSHLHEYYKLKLSLSLIEQLKMVICRVFCVRYNRRIEFRFH